MLNYNCISMTIFEIAARMDTAALARDGQPAKALVVANFGDAPFSGIAVLHADFVTRSPGLPVRVFALDGRQVPCRIARQAVGPPDEEGRRRWRFDLEFFCDLPPRTAQACGAVFASGDSPTESAEDWDARLSGGRLVAVETECRGGNLPNPCSLIS